LIKKKYLKTKNIGLVGWSFGNGHPYSWSGIINGTTNYNSPYKIINQYLGKNYKTQFNNFRITHVWTQNNLISKSIARYSGIPVVCNTLKEMKGLVDGLIIARDDYINNYNLTKEFLEAKVPIFFDKPIALNVKSLQNLYKESDKIFTCSGLRYSSIFEKININKIDRVNFYISKNWQKYAIHAIDPVVHKFKLFNQKYKVFRIKNSKKNKNFFRLCFKKIQVYIFLSNTELNLTFEFIKDKYKKVLNFNDPLNSFTKSLLEFKNCVNFDTNFSPLEEQKYIVEILEKMNQLDE
jgi:hypothetical protein